MSTHSLSDLNRAALGAKEGYGWIHLVALAYCVVIGAFSCVAWADQGQNFRAAVCGGAQLLSVIMAILGRRAMTGQMMWAGVGSILIAFGFSTWAAQGLQHAWAANGQDIEQWQVWFLTGSEPAIFLLIEHIKEGRETLRAAHEKEEEEQRLAEARERDRRLAAEAEQRRTAALPASADNVTPMRKRTAAAGAAALAAAVAVSGHGPATAAPIEPARPLDADVRSAPAHAGDKPNVAEACRLRDKGMFQEEIAAAMGKSVRQVRRYLKEAEEAGRAARGEPAPQRRAQRTA